MIDWPRARDEVFCFGWVDDVRKSMGNDVYTIGFTPRLKGSEDGAAGTKITACEIGRRK